MIGVSCLVPVYNMEKYIDQCMKCLLNQTLQNIEIVLIDDGSTDSSWEIISGYQKRYPDKIIAFQNHSNIGVGSTRNVLWKKSSGEYVAFIDCDDYVDICYCEKLYRKAKEGDFELVYCSSVLSDETGKIVDEWFFPDYLNGLMTDEKRRAIMLMPCAKFWGTLISRKFAERHSLKALEGAGFDEDIIAMLFPLQATKIGIVEESLYSWIQYPGSMSHVKKPHYEERKISSEGMYKKAIELGIEKRYSEETEFIYVYYYYMNFLRCIIDSSEYRVFPLEEMREASQMVQRRFPNYQNNRYLQMMDREMLGWCRLNDEKPEKLMKVYFEEFQKVYRYYGDLAEELLNTIKGRKLKAGIWGAGKRTRSFLQEFDSEKNIIQVIFDRDSSLWNKEIDTGHEIKDFESWEEDIDVILVLNPAHYANVKRQTMRRRVKIVDVMNYLIFQVGGLEEK